MKALGWTAFAMIVVGLIPNVLFGIGYTLTLFKDCEGMRLEGPGPCALETGLIAAFLLNTFTWPLLVGGLVLGVVWLWLRWTKPTGE